jgi:acyl-coenzyme A synthetase/AMP-(fatty) acid ligase
MNRLQQFFDRLKTYSSSSCFETIDASYTYNKLLEESERWQAELDRLGVVAGNVIGLRADYSLAAVSVLLALLSRCAVVALIPRGRVNTNYLADAFVTEFLDIGNDGRLTWHSVSHFTTHPLLDRLRDSGDGGVILFTSGSTGRPKAAVQSTERFLHKFRKPGRRFRTLAFLLFDHIAGLDTLFYTLNSGGTLIHTYNRDPRSILAMIDAREVEVLPTSPSFLRLLCTMKATASNDLSSLKIITYGSEPMDERTLSRLNLRFPGVQISQKYGTTETGSPKTVSRGNDSVWLKFNANGVETQVVNGILRIRSESTILGYLNAPSPIDEEGWYCTGDQVEVDGEWIRFCGRTADTINVGGEKVAPVEVEQVILELDFVREVLVSGDADPLLGQIVTALVSLADVETAEKEAAKWIWQHCRRRLEPYKAPVKIYFSADALSGDRYKVQRKTPTRG